MTVSYARPGALVHYVANPSEGAQMPGCHVLEKLDPSSLSSARSGALHPHFAVENRGQISRSHIALKLFFKSQAPSVMKKVHIGLDTDCGTSISVKAGGVNIWCTNFPINQEPPQNSRH